ncbi:YbaK/EbsC family protein [Cellulosilyticum sp. I15G10I2]|uniref:YbaK/EbsC family protein n=1 Tax=Cellulosilyticum sp. I15G10I2 TaxID=1892843 RepID=UPI00085C4F89|nr:YbaK/EbsC family protein [Cellulosilyticum sp. I15G10I2]
MGVAEVKKFFHQNNFNKEIIFLEESSATVTLAAKALGVDEERIAKSIAFNVKDKSILIVASGIAKIDNKKFKTTFSTKAKMMSYEETLEKTGHPVGGVCPFGLPKEVEIYIDKSIVHFDTIYPAAGGVNAIVKMTPDELIDITGGKCIDVCKITI